MNALSLTEVFSAFAATSWRAAWLVLLLVVLRRVVRARIPAGIWFFAWLVVAVRLIVPFSVPVSWSPYNFAAARVPQVDTPVAPAETPPPLVATQGTPPHSATIATLSETPVLVVPAAHVTSTPPVGAIAPIDWLAWLARIWIAGVGLLIGARVLALWRLRRTLAGAQDVDARVSALVQQEARAWGIRRRVLSLETPIVDAPALVGVWRARLLFPPGFARQLDDGELRLVVRHELAHWRRRDLLAQGLMHMAVALHWYNPFVWLAARLARTDCELACDECVLRREPTGPGAYGAALLKVLGVVRGRRRLTMAVGIFEGKQQLVQRVRMIASYRASTAGRVWGGILLVTVFTAASITRESQAQPARAPATTELRPAATASPEVPALRPPGAASNQARATDSLRDQVDAQRERVNDLAGRLQALKERSGIGSLDRQRDMIGDALKATNLELQRAGRALQAAETRLNQVKEQRARGGEFTKLPFIAEHKLVAPLLQELAMQRLQVAQLNERYRSEHPTLKAATKKLVDIEQAMERAVSLACDHVESEYQAASKNYSLQREELEKHKAEALALDRQAVALQQLQREFETQNQTLQALAARARDAMLAAQGAASPPQDTATRAGAPAPAQDQPLSVVFERNSSGWYLKEARGNQDDVARAAEQIQALKANVEAPAARATSIAVTPSPREPDEFSVSVLGAVNAQGAVTMLERHKPIVLDAIARAGGFASQASRAAVRIIRVANDGTRTTTVLSEDELMSGSGAGGSLRRGDVVVVPEMPAPTPKFVHVVGAVNRAGRIAIRSDGKPTLVEILSEAGGPTRLADLKKVKLTRIDPASKETRTEELNVDAMLKNGAIPQSSVEPGDVIFVPERIL